MRTIALNFRCLIKTWFGPCQRVRKTVNPHHCLIYFLSVQIRSRHGLRRTSRVPAMLRSQHCPRCVAPSRQVIVVRSRRSLSRQVDRRAMGSVQSVNKPAQHKTAVWQDIVTSLQVDCLFIHARPASADARPFLDFAFRDTRYEARSSMSQ